MENDVRMIDGNALKKSLQESHDELMRRRNNTPYGEERMIADAQLITFSECILRLKGQPTIDPESLRPVGEWKLHNDGSGTCSRCHFKQRNVWDYDSHQRFCGVCGAQMKGE